MTAPPAQSEQTEQTGHAVLGKSIVRVDGREKVIGQTRYTGDLRLPGMLHGKYVLSLHARARIVAIDGTAARQVPGVVDVVTGQDVLDTAPDAEDSMLLAVDTVAFYGQPVAVVLAETEGAAEEGAAAVVVEYEELPVLDTVAAALAEDAPPLHDDAIRIR